MRNTKENLIRRAEPAACTERYMTTGLTLRLDPGKPLLLPVSKGRLHADGNAARLSDGEVSHSYPSRLAIPDFQKESPLNWIKV